MRLLGQLAIACLKAAALVAAIIIFLWAFGLLNVWGTVGIGAMIIILLGIFWAIFFDREERSLLRIGAFCVAYVAVAQIIYVILEPRGLVRTDLRFTLELVALGFGSCLLFTSNGAAPAAPADPAAP
jgi:hypothetical protein